MKPSFTAAPASRLALLLGLALVLGLRPCRAGAESPYEGFEDCPCSYLGVGLPWKDYAEPAKLAALIDGKAEAYLLIDVRRPEEYESGHIRSAINIPVEELASRPPTERKDALIILYCRSGARSARAAAALEELGYRGVIDFGGLSRWPGPLVEGAKP